MTRNQIIRTYAALILSNPVGGGSAHNNTLLAFGALFNITDEEIGKAHDLLPELGSVVIEQAREVGAL